MSARHWARSAERASEQATFATTLAATLQSLVVIQSDLRAHSMFICQLKQWKTTFGNMRISDPWDPMPIVDVFASTFSWIFKLFYWLTNCCSVLIIFFGRKIKSFVSIGLRRKRNNLTELWIKSIICYWHRFRRFPSRLQCLAPTECQTLCRTVSKRFRHIIHR